MTGPRYLILDIESAPLLGYAWGIWQQNIEPMHQIVAPPRMLCYGAKWHGEKRRFFSSEYHNGREEMLTSLRDLMDEADAIVGWNSARFDRPWVVGEMDRDGMRLPAPSMDIDLMRVAKKSLRLPSYKLDYVAQRHYGLPGKVTHQGFQLWADVLSDDEDRKAKAWRQMRAYQLGDVTVTDAVFERMKPLVYKLPSPALFSEEGVVEGCGCGSTDLEKRGFSTTTTRRYQRYVCRDCGAWHQDTRSSGSVSLKRVAR